jgi:radical SAM-linked protein
VAGSKNLSVYYSKLDQAKYLGHLEMVNVFFRALKRAEIPVLFSQGFHPKPKISFDDPLPVGIESRQEHFKLSVLDFVRPEAVTQRLNAHLPDGLVINSCQLAPQKSVRQAPKANTYLVTLKEGHFDKEKLASFNRSSDATISLLNRKGKLKKINLKDMVLDIMFLDSTCLQMTLLSVPGKTVRPALILRHIFSVAEDHIKQAKVVKWRAQRRGQNGVL